MYYSPVERGSCISLTFKDKKSLSIKLSILISDISIDKSVNLMQ